jgi:glutaredoxin 3
MKRPILDQIASTLFNLEMNRVESSSVTDDKGRRGEPMEWASETSLANKFSQLVAGNDLGYKFKQWIANIVAGDYNREEIRELIDNFIKATTENDDENYARISKVKMFSFTTCPFCRSAKDYLDQEGIPYESIELDLLDGNRGNEIRAMLGEMTKRTSVPSIFVNGQAIGGLNDGMPGLMPLAKSGQLKVMLGEMNR